MFYNLGIEESSPCLVNDLRTKNTVQSANIHVDILKNTLMIIDYDLIILVPCLLKKHFAYN